MKLRWPALLMLSTVLLALPTLAHAASKDKNLNAEFRTSDRCVACHNELKTSSGEDISIGFQWRASIMANSSRDPYWQGSVRRESMDHPESKQAIQDECSICHMPVIRVADLGAGKHTQLFSRLPLQKFPHGE